MISCYSQQEKGKEAIELFKKMKQEGISPNENTYSSILKACADTKDLSFGKQIHNEIIERKFKQFYYFTNIFIKFLW